jgi:hypothetical protein
MPSNAKPSKLAAVEKFEADLRAARLKLAQAKQAFHDESMRNQGRRERETGKILLRLISEGKIDASTIAIIAEQIREHCRSPKAVAAFRGSVFEE